MDGFVCLYRLPKENPDKIVLDKQRHLINNLKLATELGAEIIKVEKKMTISQINYWIMRRKKITTVCIGKPHLEFRPNPSLNKYV